MRNSVLHRVTRWLIDFFGTCGRNSVMSRRLALAPIVYSRDPAEQSATTAEGIARLLSIPRIAHGGVTWSFPAWLIEHEQKVTKSADTPSVRTIAEQLRPRLEGGQDSLAPCGYSGAFHASLLLKELDRELDWSSRRGKQFRSALACNRPGFFHAEADLVRESALRAYRDRFAYVVAGYDQSVNATVRDLILYLADARYRLPTIALTAGQNAPSSAGEGTTSRNQARAARMLGRELLRCAAAARKRKGAPAPLVGVLVEIGIRAVPDTLPILRQLFAFLDSRCDLELLPLDGASIKRCATDVATVTTLRPVASGTIQPALFQSLPLAAAMRSTRGTVAQTRAVLPLLTPVGPATVCRPDAAPQALAIAATSSPASGVTTAAREYIASMIGAARLSEDSLAASFTNGALATLDGEEESVLSGRPAVGWVEVQARRVKRIPADVQSAFSFESRHAHGLASYATLNGPSIATPGSVQIDSLFVDGVKWLVLDVNTVLPVPGERSSVVRVTPLEIPICDCASGQAIEIETQYPDASGGAAYIEAQGSGGPRTIWGSVFRIRWENHTVSLGYPALHGPTVSPLTITVTRAGRRAYRIGLHVGGYFTRPDLRDTGRQPLRTTLCIAPGEPDASVILNPTAQLRAALAPPAATPYRSVDDRFSVR